MALKDLASDLSAYKGQTTPTAIDSQIKEGVDFFPNDDASGFTPKTNLESLYNQVREGNVVSPRTHDGTYYANLNPIEGRKSGYELNPVTYGFSRRGPNPPSEAHNDGIFYPPFGASGLNQLFEQTTLYNINQPGDEEAPFTITNQPAGNAYNSPFQPLPPYNFLNSPIANVVSMFNEDPFSVTYGTKSNPIRGDKEFNNRTYYHSGRQPAGLNRDFPFIPNAHKIAVVNTDANKTFDVTTMDDMVYGGYNLPTQNSSAGSATIDIIHDKRRGVYNEMVNTFFEHQPFPPFQEPNVSYTNQRYFSENNGKSIHISPAGQLKAGFRYGAYQTAPAGNTSEQFVNFNPGNELTDVSSAPHTTEVTLGDRLSVYDNYSTNAIPTKMVLDGDNILTPWPDRASTNLLSAFPSTDDNPYDIGTVITSNISDFFDKKSGVEKDGYDDLFEFKKGQFQNVPDGLSTNNKFGFKSYRSVANSGPFAGNDRHPFILREVGNNWGIDIFEAGSIGEIIGGMITSGAPGLTGLIDRNVTDKVRIAKFLISPQGVSFALKQVAMQTLNPTIESKIWNPLSLFGVVGMSDFADSIDSIVRGPRGFDDILTSLKGMVKAAASIAFPIGHVERHLGGGHVTDRYENVIKKNVPLGSPITKVIKGNDARRENYGRLAAAAVTFGMTPKEIDVPKSDTGIGFLDNYIDKKVEKAKDSLSDAQLVPTFTMMNPNKYLFPISSAPKSIEEGVPSFTGTADLALTDIKKAQKGGDSRMSEDGITRGGTFNKHSSQQQGDELIKRHSTLAYNKLNKSSAYEDNLRDVSLLSRNESSDIDNTIIVKRGLDKKINDGIGAYDSATVNDGKVLSGHIGVIKGDESSPNVDKINMIPIVDGDGTVGEERSGIIMDNPDFIKFRFRDIINKKFLVFRAILDGISDTVTPEYNPLEYIGRPDKLYTYKGVERDISFNFKVYPKTKQELPVLMEKMNYLIGMCYPSYTDNERMIAPYMELTLGDMFVDAPGILTGLTVNVEEASTWEIDEGLQYPHFISAQCTFKYIGRYTPVALGKFYDLFWLSDNRQTNADGSKGKPVGTYAENPAIKSKNNAIQNSSNVPNRLDKYRWINRLTGNTMQDGRPVKQESAANGAG